MEIKAGAPYKAMSGYKVYDQSFGLIGSKVGEEYEMTFEGAWALSVSWLGFALIILI